MISSTEQRNRELSAVLEVSRLLTTSFGLDDNLKRAMQSLSERLDMQRGCVFLLEPTTGEIRIAAAHGLTPDEISRGKYRIGEGIVGTVIKTGEPLFIPDINEEPLFLNKTGSRLKKSGVSFICEPITIKGETIGVLSVDRIYKEEHGGVKDDHRVLSIVASLIAQFVKLWESYQKTEAENAALKSQLKDRFSMKNVIGESERFQSMIKSVVKVAGTEATVLLLGESGTGKELIAKTIHYHSPRANGPFVAINCAALPGNLLEAELFGVEKGAFTGATSRRTGRFELAQGGTVFLDEVGEMPVGLQAKLLRALQEKSFERLGSSKSIKADIRIIAATNRDLEREIKEGRFREDLYWRLNVVPVMLPSLRERRSDIPLLIDYYIRKFNRQYNRQIALSEDAVTSMMSHDWPGNVRELANLLERVIIMSESNLVGPADLRLVRAETALPAASLQKDTPARSLQNEVVNLERQRILRALENNSFVQSHAARALGITPRQLGYRIRKYHIPLGPPGA